ncbi:MAG: hypothetical protein ACOY0T_04270 [Myxococcota bacterium]
MTNRVAVLVILSVCVGAGAFSWWQSKQMPTSLRDRGAREELERLRSEIQALKENSPARLLLEHQARELVASAKAGEKVEKSAARPAPSSEAIAPSSEAKPVPLDENEIAVQLDNHFDSESYDPKWSRSAQTQATTAITHRMTAGSRLGAVDCRSELCRVETFHENLEAFQTFVRSALLDKEREIWNGSVSSIVRSQSASGVTAVSFISREGRPMPTAGLEASND